MAAYDDPNYDPNDPYKTKPLNNGPSTPGQQTAQGSTTQPPAYNPPAFTPDPGHGTAVPPGTPAMGPGQPAPAPAAASAMPAGMDPALAAIYQNGGMTPGDRGTGFADWQYWQGVGPSQYARLAADIAGTGTDQTTGTPGSGAFQSSGRGATPAGGGTGSGYTVGQGAPGQGTVFGANNPLSGTQNALFSQLMQRAQQGLAVDPNDPNIKGETEAFNATQTRQERQYEQGLAERVGANGNIGAEQRLGSERVGQNTSAFQAQLMDQERTARRQEIAQALSGASGLLTQEQQMQLQEELQQLNLAQGAYQFDTNSQFQNSPLASGANG